MNFIDPHIHMTSRTTDDYEAMSKAGIVAIIEPAFWLGQPRTEVGSFKDYFSSIVGWESFRASQFGIKHYCTIGLNSKEANNVGLSEEVMELLPLFALKDNVVAIGEIGYDDQTAAEDKFFRAQIVLAKELNLPILVHTPHRDKKSGTLRSMDVLEEHGINPGMVIIDHNNEETVESVLNRGYWTAFTIYPKTKMGSERMVDIVKKYGPNRIIVDSSADWGVSDPLSVPKTAKLMLEKGISPEVVEKVCYYNALEAYEQSGNMKESDWLDGVKFDQSVLYGGNSVLRGQSPKTSDNADIIEN
ncbi:MAG: TatD family hydrolase [Flammeovirgaceae bacterium]|jgi:uncharacterized protein|nr:TatD family hydrolase [Flammeovirgaceae bacterium]|tara:strand:- start:11625 stop:12530 length:906 start_codon:yes stop_codon:yes gene_type:complete